MSDHDDDGVFDALASGGPDERGDGGDGSDELLDATDLALLTDLGRIFDTLDPVPDGLVDRSLFALTLEGLHAELLELRQLATPELAVRGQSEPVEARTISFMSAAVTVMIMLSEAPGGGVRVDGWCAPPMVCDVELHRPDGVTRTASDEDGSFVLAEVPRGSASLLLRPRATGDDDATDLPPAMSTPVIEL